MKKLKLPPFDYKIKRETGATKIFDIIRRKYLVLTPEEWVRQHFVHFLINHHQYPKSLISIETGFRYNLLRKRSDIIIYDKSGNPFLLVECKSADYRLSKNAVFQAITYNKSIQAKYIVITNGMKYLCARMQNPTDMEWIDTIPAFPG